MSSSFVEESDEINLCRVEKLTTERVSNLYGFIKEYMLDI